MELSSAKNTSLLKKYSNIPHTINTLLSENPMLSASMMDSIIAVILGLCKLFVNNSKDLEKLKGWNWSTSTLSTCLSLSNFSPQDELLENLGISSKKRNESFEMEYNLLISSHIKFLQNHNIKFDEIFNFSLSLILNLYNNDKPEISSEIMEEVLIYCSNCKDHLLYSFFVNFICSSPIYPNQIPDTVLCKIWSFSLPLFQEQVSLVTISCIYYNLFDLKASKLIVSECNLISKQLKPFTNLFSIKFCNILLENAVLFFEFSSMLKSFFFEAQTEELSILIGKFFEKMAMKTSKFDSSLVTKVNFMFI